MALPVPGEPVAPMKINLMVHCSNRAMSWNERLMSRRVREDPVAVAWRICASVIHTRAGGIVAGGFVSDIGSAINAPAGARAAPSFT